MQAESKSRGQGKSVFLKLREIALRTRDWSERQVSVEGQLKDSSLIKEVGEKSSGRRTRAILSGWFGKSQRGLAARAEENESAGSIIKLGVIQVWVDFQTPQQQFRA